jgi:hypothetical protein
VTTIKSIVSVVEVTAKSTVTVPVPSHVPKGPNLCKNGGFEVAYQKSFFYPWVHTGGGAAGVTSDDESSKQSPAIAHGGTHFCSIANFKNLEGPTYLSQDISTITLNKS